MSMRASSSNVATIFIVWPQAADLKSMLSNRDLATVANTCVTASQLCRDTLQAERHSYDEDKEVSYLEGLSVPDLYDTPPSTVPPEFSDSDAEEMWWFQHRREQMGWYDSD